MHGALAVPIGNRIVSISNARGVQSMGSQFLFTFSNNYHVRISSLLTPISFSSCTSSLYLWYESQATSAVLLSAITPGRVWM